MRRFLFLSGLLALSGCGGDKKDDAAAAGPKVNYTSTLAGGKVEINFDAATVGQQFLISPFWIGAAGNEGATGAYSAFTVTGTAAGSLRGGSPLRREGDEVSTSTLALNRSNLARAAYHRLDAQRGPQAQDPAFWQAVDAHDKADRLINERMGFTLLRTAHPLRDEVLRLMAHADSYELKATSAPLTAGCPAVGANIPLPEDEVAITAVESADDFCLIITDDSKHETVANMKASIVKILSIYKTKIYGDSFPAKTDLTFKPYFIVTDFSLMGGLHKALGVFVGTTTKTEKVPMLYMTHDLTKAGKTNDAAGIAEFHGAMAHEMQHAISYYYKGGDAAYVDEGLAHFMESLFGYRAANFKTYAKAFLDARAFGFWPFFGGAYDATNDTIYRGAGETFFYYLASQMGGVTFGADGLPSGGDGLTYIANVVKSADKGMANVKAKFTKSSSWVTTVGNYIGALYLDNSGAPVVEEEFTVKPKVSTVTNLQGATGQVFGMRFNNEDALGTVFATAEAYDKTKWPAEGEHVGAVQAYQTKPFLFAPTTGNLKVTVSSNADGAGVSVARIK